MALSSEDRFILGKTAGGAPAPYALTRAASAGDRFILAQATNGVVPMKVVRMASAEDRGFLAQATDGPVPVIGDTGGRVLYIGGGFTSVGGIRGRLMEKSASGWKVSGDGMNGDAYCAQVYDGVLYLGGAFTQNGPNTVTYGRFAKWNPTTEKWDNPVGAGMNGGVYTMTTLGANLVLGGAFSTADGGTVRRCALWNGSAFDEPETGFNNSVYTVIVYGGSLYAVGAFTQDGTAVKSLLRVAKYDAGADTWATVGNGADGLVMNAVEYGGDLWVCGFFTNLDGAGIKYVARWNGTAWSQAGSGLFNNAVYGLVVAGSTLYCTGIFSTYDGDACVRVARWNTTSNDWEPFDEDGVANRNPAIDPAYAYALGSQFLYGQINTWQPNSVDVTAHVVEWSGSAWNLRLDENWSRVPHLFYSHTDRTFYGGGLWTSTGDVRRIAKTVAKLPLETMAWETMNVSGTWGPPAARGGTSGTTWLVCEYEDQLLFVTSGASNTYINAYDPETDTWSDWPSTGKGVIAGSSQVYGMVVDPADGLPVFYGQFTSVDGTAVKHAAKINPDTSAVTDFMGGVLSISTNITRLVKIGTTWYASGNFTQINGTDTVYYHIYNSGGGWQAMPMITSHSFAIIQDPFSDDIIFGGDFTQNRTPAPDRYYSRLARWKVGDSDFRAFDGDVSGPTTNGVNARVYDIVLDPDGNLRIGGLFSAVNVGSKTARGAAVWDNNTLEPFGVANTQAWTAGAGFYKLIYEDGELWSFGNFALTLTDVRGTYNDVAYLARFDADNDKWLQVEHSTSGGVQTALFVDSA